MGRFFVSFVSKSTEVLEASEFARLMSLVNNIQKKSWINYHGFLSPLFGRCWINPHTKKKAQTSQTHQTLVSDLFGILWSSDVLGSYPKKSPLDLGKGTVREASKTKPLFFNKKHLQKRHLPRKTSWKKSGEAGNSKKPQWNMTYFLIPSSKCNDRGGDWQWGEHTKKNTPPIHHTNTLIKKPVVLL